MTETVLLYLLNQKDRYMGELTQIISQRSGGKLHIVFPYGAIYWLQYGGYIVEKEKRITPDGRRRQYFAVTDRGREYLSRLLQTYFAFSQGIAEVLSEEEKERTGQSIGIGEACCGR